MRPRRCPARGLDGRRPPGAATARAPSRIPDSGQVQSVRRAPSAGGGPRLSLEQCRESWPATAGRAATSSIVPTSTRFMWRMKASASIQNSSMSPLARRSQRALSTSRREADVVGLGRGEGGEVVRARRARAAHASRAAAVERPCGQCSARPRSWTLRARRGSAAGSSRRGWWRPGGRRSRAARPRTRARPRRRAAARSAARTAGRLARVAGHLTPGVDARVGPSGHRQRHRRRGAARRPAPARARPGRCAARAAAPSRRSRSRRIRSAAASSAPGTAAPA